MRQRFLTVYDYGTGGVWQWIIAESPEQITAKYPQLTVLKEMPTWWQERPMTSLRSYDIDDKPDDVLLAISREKT